MENKYQDLSMFSVPNGFRGRSKIFTQVWWLVQASLFALSPQVFYGWRVFLLRTFGAKIGDGVKIRPSAKFTYPWKIEIGDHCWIGDRAELYSLVEISIGSHCCISQDCYLATAGHDHRKLDFAYVTGKIEVEPEAWLASGTFVSPGVKIGRGAVVAARSVVVRDIDEAEIVAGVPAKRMGMRTSLTHP